MAKAASTVSLLEQTIEGSTKLAETSKQTYLVAVRDFLGFAGSHHGSWTPLRVEQWRDSLAERGLSSRTINLYLTAVRYVAKRCEALHGMPDFARSAEAVRQVAAKHPKKHALTQDQCRKLLATCAGSSPPDMRDRAMILVGIHAALRRKELCRIDLADIAPERITVIAKGGKAHSIALPEEAWRALCRWRDWVKRRGIVEGRLFRSIRPRISGDWDIGRSISETGFYKVLKKRARDAGLGNLNVHPHGLRHTHVWLALEAGVPIWRVQMVLGHKSRVMTLYYAEDLYDDAVGAAFPSLT
jgi:integrase